MIHRAFLAAVAGLLAVNASPAAPSLYPTFGSGTINLSWDGSAVGWILESSTDIGADAPWTRITTDISVEGGNFVWSAPAAGGRVFYRLHNVGEPITAPNQQWTWVDFPDAFAMEGTTTGIGVNFSAGSSKVLIFLMGGGACWDEQTCYTLNTATHGPFAAAQFAQVVPALSFAWPLNRFDTTNPFRDYNFVFVPYVTGDLHAGSNEISHGPHVTKHVGYKNVSAYLRRLSATFPQASRVVLAGVSAGGYGAVFNWGQVQENFPTARVDVIDDSGPFLAQPGGFLNAAAQASWNLSAALPEDCATCEANPAATFTYYAAKFPASRAAFLSFNSDPTIAGYFMMPLANFPAALDGYLTQYVAPTSNARYFIAAESGHVLLSRPFPVVTQGISTLDFLARMLNDDPAWSSVRP